MVILMISQRVKMAGVNKKLQVGMKITKVHPIDEEMKMEIDPLDEEKSQKLRLEMAGIK